MARLVELLWRWRGLAADETRGAYIAGIVMLNIMCVAMVATQLNYVVVGDVHMILVLAPIVGAALFYGPRVAALTGGIAGLAELIHATYLPLDYYEKYFMAPWNSVLLFALVGLIVGLMYAWPEYYGDKSGWRRPVGLVLGCALGSLFFTLYFQTSTLLINAALEHEVPHDPVVLRIRETEDHHAVPFLRITRDLRIVHDGRSPVVGEMEDLVEASSVHASALAVGIEVDNVLRVLHSLRVRNKNNLLAKGIIGGAKFSREFVASDDVLNSIR